MEQIIRPDFAHHQSAPPNPDPSVRCVKDLDMGLHNVGRKEEHVTCSRRRARERAPERAKDMPKEAKARAGEVGQLQWQRNVGIRSLAWARSRAAMASYSLRATGSMVAGAAAARTLLRLGMGRAF